MLVGGFGVSVLSLMMLALVCFGGLSEQFSVPQRTSSILIAVHYCANVFMCYATFHTVSLHYSSLVTVLQGTVFMDTL